MEESEGGSGGNVGGEGWSGCNVGGEGGSGGSGGNVGGEGGERTEGGRGSVRVGVAGDIKIVSQVYLQFSTIIVFNTQNKYAFLSQTEMQKGAKLPLFAQA